MTELVFVVEESPEGGYVAQAVGQSIVTEADTLEALRANVREAVACHFAGRGGGPQAIRLHMVHDEVIAA
jgi:predicted RNase H-like HicB family nuclease